MTLSLRLTFLLLAIFVFASAVAVIHGYRVADSYFQSETQALGAPIAMYIADNRSPFRDGVFDAEKFHDLAQSAMILNPAIDIYALDAAGRVLAQGGDGRVLARGRIELAPLLEFFTPGRAVPLLGDDPRHASRKSVFSVAAAGPAHNPWGYVYVVLDSGARRELGIQSLPLEFRALASGGLAALLLSGFAVAAVMFVYITMPLRALARDMSAFVAKDPARGEDAAKARNDEIAILQQSFLHLRARVDEQMLALRRADSGRREWIAHLSHDLRAPLTMLQSHLERALRLDGTASASERREAIARGLMHCDQIRRMLEELFESARLEAPALQLRLESFELAELVQDAVAGLASTADRAMVNLRFEMDVPGAAWVIADISLIQRLIDNLLINAVKACRRGGVVTAGVRRDGSTVTLTVADDGEGPTADMRCVLDESRNPSIGAGGMGLRIIGQILRLHRLQSCAANAAGGGSLVTIHFPACSEIPSSPALRLRR